MQHHYHDRIKIFVMLALLFVFVTGCASSGGNKIIRGPSLLNQIKSKNYTAAKKQLNYLYSVYPTSYTAETRFVRRTVSAVYYLPEKHEEQLQTFLNLNRSSVPGLFFEAKYFFYKGLASRGEKSAANTSKEAMKGMVSNFVNAVSRLQSVLERDPNSYLAHSYMAVMFSYQGANEAAEREFRKALAIKPESFSVWSQFLVHKTPRWGGSYEEMEVLLKEMRAYEGRNRRLRNLQGVALADKANVAIRNERFAEAEEWIFEAWKYAPYPAYGKTVDYLYRKVRDAGDKAGACRITRKIHALEPTNPRHKTFTQECDAAGL